LDSPQKFTYIIITRAITILLKIVGFVTFDKIVVIYRDSVKFYCQFKYILDQLYVIIISCIHAISILVSIEY
jgi:hypothetical protein